MELIFLLISIILLFKYIKENLIQIMVFYNLMFVVNYPFVNHPWHNYLKFSYNGIKYIQFQLNYNYFF